MIGATVLNIDLEDVDVSYDVISGPSDEVSTIVVITSVGFRGVEIKHLLKRKELRSIELSVECLLEDEFFKNKGALTCPKCGIVTGDGEMCGEHQQEAAEIRGAV